MEKLITIDPVTRIEGHSKITIRLDDQGKVEVARLHITQFRGFEKFTEGRPFQEMPSLTARTCGICPISHLLASAKACDSILAVRIPESAAMLRRVINYAQIIQSHALSFFHLSSPDLLLGMDSDPASRHIFGVAAQFPELAKDGIWLRKFGQRIIERMSGKRIHPTWIVPGGVSSPLSAEVREQIVAELPQAIAIAHKTLEWFKPAIKKYQDEIDTFANFPSLFLALVLPDGTIEHYDGLMRVVDSQREIIVDKLEPSAYTDYIAEAVEPDSYLKSPFFKPFGYPEGMYRVGPLARLNVCDRMGTPLAERELDEFRALQPDGAVLSSFHFHYARLIEILYALERVSELLGAPEILNTRVRAMAEPNKLEGIGVSEAPRGTLIHHYKIDTNGLITWANLIIATGHNNLAMNQGITQAAKHFVDGMKITEGALNRVEAVIRCYDPCLSCSTHALGEMPLRIELTDPAGEILDACERA
ncbi:Ni/Fe hydrogenase subunit alpha [Propionivibrio sp.]|uniref:Ni/Fe hydrogenase subunit alpha n=1 Tax=Propionivibrio sp. TaxID=2212460 RepID=UPI00261A6426|nr:Ni/Fe hydrogenase subunit alpha [Propionivibrio sp.]